MLLTGNPEWLIPPKILKQAILLPALVLTFDLWF
jgi:hypothetical protein